MRAAGRGVDQHGLEVGVLAGVAEVGGGQELVRDERAVLLPQRHQERQVGELLHVVDEPRHLPIAEELGEYDVSHRHPQRPVGTGMR